MHILFCNLYVPKRAGTKKYIKISFLGILRLVLLSILHSSIFFYLLTSDESHALPCLLTQLLTPWSRVLFLKLTGSQLVKNSPPVMELEGSLPRLQVPATCLYPELDKSSPCSSSHFHLCLGLPSGLCPPGFHVSPLPHKYYMPRLSHSSRFDHLNNIW
jgi:hypothetical protein